MLNTTNKARGPWETQVRVTSRSTSGLSILEQSPCCILTSARGFLPRPHRMHACYPDKDGVQYVAALEVAVVPGAHIPWPPPLFQALGTALNRCAASARGARDPSLSLPHSPLSAYLLLSCLSAPPRFLEGKGLPPFFSEASSKAGTLRD